jgi:hypothetical protein
MGDLPASNPALAKKVWEGMAYPSARRVARKMRQAGMPISHQTINGCCSRSSGRHWSMKTNTHFAFRVGIWDDTGDSILEHVAGVEDFEVAEATYRAAVARWPSRSS